MVGAWVAQEWSNLALWLAKLTMWVLVSFGSVSGQGNFGGGGKVDEDEDGGVRVLLSRWLLCV